MPRSGNLPDALSKIDVPASWMLDESEKRSWCKVNSSAKKAGCIVTLGVASSSITAISMLVRARAPRSRNDHMKLTFDSNRNPCICTRYGYSKST